MKQWDQWLCILASLFKRKWWTWRVQCCTAARLILNGSPQMDSVSLETSSAMGSWYCRNEYSCCISFLPLWTIWRWEVNGLLLFLAETDGSTADWVYWCPPDDYERPPGLVNKCVHWSRCCDCFSSSSVWLSLPWCQVRVKCQPILRDAMSAFRYSSRMLLPLLLEKLQRNDSVSHEQFKASRHCTVDAVHSVMCCVMCCV